MDFVTVVLIAIGLAMDAFAVSIAKGISVNRNRRRSAILLAFLFGGFQALMPVIGWLAGLGLRDIIMGIDHWIAFGLLGIIGAKMIYDSTKSEDGKEEDITLFIALTLAVATSIDALMVGLSFAFFPEWKAVASKAVFVFKRFSLYSSLQKAEASKRPQ